MTGNEIRTQFLKYFEDKGHSSIESSSLVPHDDPTLLFTNAGMVQFKRVFMGEEKRGYLRAATSQRCVRAGGKHNDLENVGHTARHHTFFEMLGNFSFGDYFKKDAISYGWDFLTNVLGLPKDKMWISVFEDDDEAFSMWEEIEDLPEGRIVRMGEKDNFWAMGDTGPCGPCSEIHIDQGPEVGCGNPECKLGDDCDCDRYLELWNLVFMQFYRDETGKMTPLPKPSIDTGMGLERIAAVMQGKQSNYDSDLFCGMIQKIASLSGHVYGADQSLDTAMRVISDHCRATTFLVADGVLPSNEGRGYVLRRIMRRAMRFGRALGLNEPFMNQICAEVLTQMHEAYPHLRESEELLTKVVLNEEERFGETLDNGLQMLQDEISRLMKAGEKRVGGQFAFTLYDTYGFPIDIVRDVTFEKEMTVDEDGFANEMEQQRQRSKKSWKEGGLGAMANGIRKLIEAGHKSSFTGYTSHQGTSVITGIIDSMGEGTTNAGSGDVVSIFCPETPFYAEAGGQIGDQGHITGPTGKAKITDTITVGDGLVLHEAQVTEGSLSVNDKVDLNVSEGRRQKIANNHTATHILHAAMKQVLGEHVKQSGSLVTQERLRFDFTHFSPISRDEIIKIERIANEEIRSNTSIATEMLSKDDAVDQGAVALFGEKYGESVRVVSIGSFSKELCGGTHVGLTGDIGLVKITSEAGIAAGVRRIEAVTGQDALDLSQQNEKLLADLGEMLKSPTEELQTKLNKILSRQKELEKKVSQLTARLSLSDLDNIIQSSREIKNIKVISSLIQLDSPKTLREVGDKIRDKMGSGIVVLGGSFQEKAALLVIVSKDLTGRIQAGNIIKEIAGIVGGSGGGRPDMAQAGGPMADKLPAALESVYKVIETSLV